MSKTLNTVAVLGAGIQGCCLALALGRRGIAVDLIDRRSQPMLGTSVNNEGKVHLGFVYTKDPLRETHRLMARGALAFSSALREIADIEPALYTQGTRFHYAVPHHSQLSCGEVEAHFQRVEETALAEQEASGDTYLGRRLHRLFRRADDVELRQFFAPSTVAAAFETEEEAVDPLRLADLLRNAVLRHPRIRFLGEALVSEATITSDEEVHLVLMRGEERTRQRYAAVANCLWAGRLKLDASLGLMPTRPWLFRYKALVRVLAPELASCAVPSTTLVVGSYGDVVNYGGGSFYISWYPNFKLAETRELDGFGLYDSLEGVDHRQLAKGGIEAMAAYVPELDCLLGSQHKFEVGGGVIFGWGSTDIDDPQSGLHERWRIGPQRHGPYVTVDTGKYTMAPYFALESRRMIEEILA